MTYYKPEEIFTIFDSEKFDRYLIYHTSFNKSIKLVLTHNVIKSMMLKQSYFHKVEYARLSNIKNTSSPIYKK